MNDSTKSYHFKIDTLTKTAVLYPLSDTLDKSRFNYVIDRFDALTPHRKNRKGFCFYKAEKCSDGKSISGW